MKTKQRKRMRGFDIYQYIAFHSIPKIKNVKIYTGPGSHTDNPCFVELIVEPTGEIFERICSTPADCTALAKAVNKELKHWERWEKEHNK